jgi:hypothetical protein
MAEEEPELALSPKIRPCYGGIEKDSLVLFWTLLLIPKIDIEMIDNLCD